jgi:hypothetical protein
MGTLEGFPNPPAKGLRPTPKITMGTLEGFPNPPAKGLRPTRSTTLANLRSVGQESVRCKVRGRASALPVSPS